MLLQRMSRGVKSVVINSNFLIFAAGKPLDPQMKLASLASGSPIRNPGYAPGWFDMKLAIFRHDIALDLPKLPNIIF